jgi:hypothetical protein
MSFPSHYHSLSDILVEEKTTANQKIQRLFASGKREVLFPNNIRRTCWPDGYSVVYFANNDIKQTYPEQEKVVYFFAKVGTTHTTFTNGVQVFRFESG